MRFFKYQGTGNDFVMVDQRYRHTIKRSDKALIARLCDRRFGIGADGLILLQQHPTYDFEMLYFNADGAESSMCGNGGRCIVGFAKHLGIIEDSCTFLAIDGAHDALIKSEKNRYTTWVELKMSDVQDIEKTDSGDYILDTGSPHFVRFVENIAECDIRTIGRSIRYSDRFAAAGINVNLVAAQPTHIAVLTYERGVEDETLSCGTGVTAAAIAHFFHKKKAQKGTIETKIKAKGGDLAVRFSISENNKATSIWLCGPAERAFEGRISI